VNPGGIVHDTVTVELEADQIGVTLDLALPCLKDTWFPGYGWIPSYCSFCDQHMGWKFTKMVPATEGPDFFYGFTRRSIQISSKADVNAASAIYLNELDLIQLMLNKSRVKHYEVEEHEVSDRDDNPVPLGLSV